MTKIWYNIDPIKDEITLENSTYQYASLTIAQFASIFQELFESIKNQKVVKGIIISSGKKLEGKKSWEERE